MWCVSLLENNETGIIGKAEEKCSFEVDFWRRILKIKRIDHLTNEEVFRRVGDVRNLLLKGYFYQAYNCFELQKEGRERKNSTGRPPLTYGQKIFQIRPCIIRTELRHVVNGCKPAVLPLIQWWLIRKSKVNLGCICFTEITRCRPHYRNIKMKKHLASWFLPHVHEICLFFCSIAPLVV